MPRHLRLHDGSRVVQPRGLSTEDIRRLWQFYEGWPKVFDPHNNTMLINEEHLHSFLADFADHVLDNPDAYRRKETT